MVAIGLVGLRRKMIEIWEPRYRDKKVLVASSKAKGNIEIAITKGFYKGEYRVNAEDVLNSPKEMMATKSGGEIEVVCIPLEKLEKIENES